MDSQHFSPPSGSGDGTAVALAVRWKMENAFIVSKVDMDLEIGWGAINLVPHGGTVCTLVLKNFTQS